MSLEPRREFQLGDKNLHLIRIKVLKSMAIDTFRLECGETRGHWLSLEKIPAFLRSGGKGRDNKESANEIGNRKSYRNKERSQRKTRNYKTPRGEHRQNTL